MQSRLTITGDIGGIGLSSTVVREADGQIAHSVSIPAAKAGTLSTRTDDTIGTLTLAADHGISTADKIEIYWDGGRRYDVLVGTVAGTSVPFTAGSGDNLPAEDTAVTAQTRQVIDTDFDADLLVAIGSLCAQRAHISFFESGDVLALALDLVAAEIWYWLDGGTAVNPLAGKTVDYVTVTQASTTATTLKLGILYDSTE